MVTNCTATLLTAAIAKAFAGTSAVACIYIYIIERIVADLKCLLGPVQSRANCSEVCISHGEVCWVETSISSLLDDRGESRGQQAAAPIEKSMGHSL